MAGVKEAIDYALAQVGDPYVWGAEGPDGFDCSGLVYAAFRAAGFDVQRTTAAVIGGGGGGFAPLKDSSGRYIMRPGSVLYWDNPGPTDHVAIYLGDNKMVEAPQAGSPVRVTNVRTPDRVLSVRSSGSGTADTYKDTPLPDGADRALDGALDAVAGLNPFAVWQADATRIGLTLLGGVAAAALVIVGAKQALTDKGHP